MCEICDRKIYLVRDIVRYMWVGVSVRDTYDCELTSNVHRTERMSLSVACWGIRYTHFITLSLSLSLSLSNHLAHSQNGKESERGNNNICTLPNVTLKFRQGCTSVVGGNLPRGVRGSKNPPSKW